MTIDRPCQFCGGPIEVSRSREAKTKKFCSRFCGTRFWQEGHRQEARDNARAWYRANPDKAFATRLKRNHGVTPEWYRTQYEKQDGRCDICKALFLDPKDTHIDHNHETGVRRALLCRLCNNMLGLAREDPAILAAAIEYLASHS